MPNKELGQHWLHDELFLNAVVDAADIKTGDRVIEIGPGLGTLTNVLIERGAEITAVEFDANLASTLTRKLVDINNITVVNQDILQFNFEQITGDYKICGNIPYYLTSKLIRNFSQLKHQPLQIGLLIQKEVAERIVAEPGKMSILSVAAQTFANCNLGPVVPAAFFTPPPKVDSRIISFKPLPMLNQKLPENFFRIVKAGFSKKRKKLVNSLSGGLSLPKQVIEEILKQHGMNSNVRAQELSLDDWRNLTTTLNPYL